MTRASVYNYIYNVIYIYTPDDYVVFIVFVYLFFVWVGDLSKCYNLYLYIYYFIYIYTPDDEGVGI